MIDLIGQLFVNFIASASAYVLVTFGFSIIYFATKEFHIAHALSFTVASYAGYFLFKHGFGLIGAIVGGVIAGGIYGFFVDRYVYRYLRRFNASTLQKFIVSLGFLTFLTACIELVFGQDNLYWGAASNTIKIGNFILSYYYAILIVLTVIILSFVGTVLRKRVIWFELKAVSSNIDVARNVGINVSRVYSFAYIIGSAMVAPVAVLMSADISTNPYRGMSITLLAIISTLIGGGGSYAGAIMVAIIISLIENLSLLFISSEWVKVVVSVIFLLTLLVRPYGLFGKQVRGKGGKA